MISIFSNPSPIVKQVNGVTLVNRYLSAHYLSGRLAYCRQSRELSCFSTAVFIYLTSYLVVYRCFWSEIRITDSFKIKLCDVDLSFTADHLSTNLVKYLFCSKIFDINLDSQADVIVCKCFHRMSSLSLLGRTHASTLYYVEDWFINCAMSL